MELKDKYLVQKKFKVHLQFLYIIQSHDLFEVPCIINNYTWIYIIFIILKIDGSILMVKVS